MGPYNLVYVYVQLRKTSCAVNFPSTLPLKPAIAEKNTNVMFSSAFTFGARFFRIVSEHIIIVSLIFFSPSDIRKFAIFIGNWGERPFYKSSHFSDISFVQFRCWYFNWFLNNWAVLSDLVMSK